LPFFEERLQEGNDGHTWDDTNSSSFEKDEEYAASLCLMVDSDKQEIFNFESVLDFQIIKSSCF